MIFVEKAEDIMKKRYFEPIFVIGLLLLSKIMIYVMYVALFGETDFMLFLNKINRFDAHHYMNLISNWYTASANSLVGEAEWAFFPLFPGIIRVICNATGMEAYAVSFILNTLFQLMAVYYGMKCLENEGATKSVQIIYAFLLTLGCYSFYFSILYTEALCLLLTTLCFYFLQKKQYRRMGFAGLLLTLTRNMGIFFEFVILVRWIMDYFDNKKSQKDEGFGAYAAASLKDPSLVLGVSLIPVGMFGYMAYLYYKVGDALAFVHVQHAWGRDNTLFIKVLINSLKDISGNAAYCAWWGILGLWAVWLMIVKYGRYHEALYGFMYLALSMSSATDSVPRYMLGAFVFYKLFTMEISSLKWYNKLVILLLVFGYELVLINGWLYGNGVLT